MNGASIHCPARAADRQARHLVRRQQRHEARVGMRRNAELIVCDDILRRIVRHAQLVHRVRERLVEIVRRQFEREGVERHQFQRQGFQGIGIGRARFAKAGQIRRPLVGTNERLSGQHIRMVCRQIAGHEERFVDVRLVVLIELRMPCCAATHRQIADVELIELDRELRLERKLMESAGGIEGADRSGPAPRHGW